MRDRQPATILFVLPAYNEAENIAVFHRALIDATDSRPDLRFEFVYVDDDSRDDTLDRVLELRVHDSRVSVLALSRNYGHQMAVTAGLDVAAAADAVIVMDTDLQDPPRVAVEMIARWENGAEVVYAQRRTRDDPLFKRASAWAFYWLLHRTAAIDIPRNVGDFRLMDRKVVGEVNRYREHDRFLRGIVTHVGFRQEALLFDRDCRHAGESGYPLRKMVALAANGILGFSTTPLKVISRFGLAISLLSLMVGCYALFARIFQPETTIPGWAFLGVGMFMLGGLQLTMMGVIGSYLGRVYIEVQNRPLYSVRFTTRERDPADPPGGPAGPPDRPRAPLAHPLTREIDSLGRG
jgi:glycosyltransferase involved in cell wall biosynthesis